MIDEPLPECSQTEPAADPFHFDVEPPDFEGKTLDDLGGVTPTAYVCGPAGTGKTTLLRKKLTGDPDYGVVCATTGVAAINLGGKTVNSVLGYSDIEALQDNYLAGYLRKKMKDLRDDGCRWIIIDETSMLSYKALDIFMLGLRDLNEDNPGRQPLGLLLVADFGQLPPIGDVMMKDGRPVIERKKEKREPAPWVFKSSEWAQFERNMIKLTKVHRQSDARFLQALHAIRRGQGNVGASLLKRAGVNFTRLLDANFPGTTIMPKNDEVDRLNALRLHRLPGREVKLPNKRWLARQYSPSDWKIIPEELTLKEGAYVMLLTNDCPEFHYVNGDCGIVKQLDEECVTVELVRTGEEVEITPITRYLEQKAEPNEEEVARGARYMELPFAGRTRWAWVLGELTYWPLRLAYGTTVHKAQGLSLDLVQIDPRGHFFGAPNMAYVAVSRARTPEGLVIVGTPQAFSGKAKADENVRKWL